LDGSRGWQRLHLFEEQLLQIAKSLGNVKERTQNLEISVEEIKGEEPKVTIPKQVSFSKFKKINSDRQSEILSSSMDTAQNHRVPTNDSQYDAYSEIDPNQQPRGYSEDKENRKTGELSSQV